MHTQLLLPFSLRSIFDSIKEAVQKLLTMDLSQGNLRVREWGGSGKRLWSQTNEYAEMVSAEDLPEQRTGKLSSPSAAREHFAPIKRRP